MVILSFHSITYLLSNKFEGSEDLNSLNSLLTIREWFELGIYYHLIVFASPLLFIALLNKLTNSELTSEFYTTSDIITAAVFCLLLALTFLPVLSIMMGKGERHFSIGLKKDRKAKLYYTVTMLKFFAYSIIFLMVNSKKVQVGLLLSLTLASLIYLI